MHSPDPDETTLDVTVERIVFENPENGWTVLRARRESTPSLVTAVGRMPGVAPGERLRLTGSWITDRKYGRQFRTRSYLARAPQTLRGIERYLGSGALPGIGETMAKRIVQTFGERTLDVLDEEPERLSEVPGIGPVRSQRIVQAWREKRVQRDALIFLQGHGISPGLAAKILRRYGEAAVSVVRNQPFRLAEEVSGVGFAAADGIASSLGLAADAPERAAAGVLFALHRAEREGHVFQWLDRLALAAAELLAIPLPRVEEAVGSLAERQAVRTEQADEGTRVYLPELWSAEEGIVADLGRLRRKPTGTESAKEAAAIESFEKETGFHLAPVQRQAVGAALHQRVLVITGGPGTGKTTLVRAIVAILRRKEDRVLLAAPTGRAAQRLGEATGAEVRTVHRLLEFDPHLGVFRRHRQRPLEADLVLVDEASMLDAPLAGSLLEAIPDGGRLVLVGDVDQLPSVGPGRVLADLIDSEAVPVVRLRQIFRQAAASRIVVNAHRILRGASPQPAESADSPESDFFFIRRSDPEELLATLLHLVGERIPAGFGLSPHHDIQILSPMRRGILGTENLNRSLQELLNPDAPRASEKGPLRVGDRVMQVRNNYDLEVFNGDVGRIRSADVAKRRLVVSFEDRLVRYDRASLDQLQLAYACTVHKAQGSEYPCVVLPLHTQHFMMLQRNLLYTAVTRASRLMILVGDPRALDLALRNRKQSLRLTALAEKLRRPARGRSPSPAQPRR